MRMADSNMKAAITHSRGKPFGSSSPFGMSRIWRDRVGMSVQARPESAGNSTQLAFARAPFARNSPMARKLRKNDQPRSGSSLGRISESYRAAAAQPIARTATHPPFTRAAKATSPFASTPSDSAPAQSASVAEPAAHTAQSTQRLVSRTRAITPGRIHARTAIAHSAA